MFGNGLNVLVDYHFLVARFDAVNLSRAKIAIKILSREVTMVIDFSPYLKYLSGTASSSHWFAYAF